MKRRLLRLALYSASLLLLPLVTLHAALLPGAEALNRARDWMSNHPVMGAAATRVVDSAEVFQPVGGAALYVVRLNPSGYLVLHADADMPLVLAFSPDASIDLTDQPENAFRALLNRHATSLAAARAAGWQPAARTPLGVTELYGPFLSTIWNQCNPYNLLAPDAPDTGEYYDYRAPSGCVPTAFAQILYFHSWPVMGFGGYSYTDSSGSITGYHEADFSNGFDWDAMLDDYDPWDPNPPAAEAAVSELMYELGVAAGANFEASGTSASTKTLGERLGSYFYFDDIAWQANLAALTAPLEADLRAGFPCVVSIPGHAIVADGLMVEDGVTTYHINYGWGGSNNGWWTAAGVPGGGLEDGVTSLRPSLLAFPATTTVNGVVSEPLDLQWLLPLRRAPETSQLILYRLEEQPTPWFTDASELPTGSNADWSLDAAGYAGDAWYAGPYGPASLVLSDTITPDASTHLQFKQYARLDTATFSVELSTDDGTSFTTIYTLNSVYHDAYHDVSISLAAYAGQPVRLRFALSSGSYYTSGGIWLDNLGCSTGTWQSWVPLQNLSGPHLLALNTPQAVPPPAILSQPVHSTTWTNPPAGTHTLAARLLDTNAALHGLAPAFTVIVNDGDSLPDDWENLYGLDTTRDDSGEDPDNDGYTNEEEYLLGSHPGLDTRPWPWSSNPGGAPVLEMIENRTYTIWSRSNLLSGTWTLLTNIIPANTGPIALEQIDAPTQATRYYRVGVQQN